MKKNKKYWVIYDGVVFEAKLVRKLDYCFQKCLNECVVEIEVGGLKREIEVYEHLIFESKADAEIEKIKSKLYKISKNLEEKRKTTNMIITLIGALFVALPIISLILI